jgi:hypothetical protein
VIACLGVAIAEALSIAFQVTSVPVARELIALIALLPYVTTVAVLIAFRGDRRTPPRSLGDHGVALHSGSTVPWPGSHCGASKCFGPAMQVENWAPTMCPSIATNLPSL